MHKESKTVQIGINYYCVYCGNKTKENSEYWGDNEFTYHHYCDSCELGKEETILHDEIAQVIKKHGGYEKFKRIQGLSVD